MTEKEAIAQDWKMVGDAFRVVLGQKNYRTPGVNSQDAFLKGILTLNPFGSITRNRCKHR